MAKDFSENLLFDEIVERSKRDGQDAEQDIGQRQIGDEAIRGRLYRPVLVDDKDDDVKNIIVHLHRRTAFQSSSVKVQCIVMLSYRLLLKAVATPLALANNRKLLLSFLIVP